jgi:uncharacterized protein
VIPSSLRLPFLLGILLAAAVCVSAALALEFPALTGRVVDNAKLLSSGQQSALTAQLASHEEATSNQVVVVTLPSLQGTTIDDFGYQLGRHWGIGQAGRDNGVLLIVAPNERKVRIEVGYGLEGDLPDAIARAIIDNDILPAFRRNDYPGGIQAGVDSIILAIEGAYEPQKKKQNKFGWLPILFIALIFGTMVFHYFLDNFDRKNGRWVRRRRPRERSGSFYGFGGGSSGGGGGGGGFGGGGGGFGGGGSSGGW